MRRPSSYLWGPLSWLGVTVALLACLADQITKLWILYIFDLGGRRVVPLAPVLDLTLIWNSGISYGLFQHESPRWQWVLFAVKALAVGLLWVWLTRAGSRLAAIALGLIIGGALGNSIDRLLYGAVADFVHFHIGSFSWYVFNVADTAIVAGVVGLLYDALQAQSAATAPRANE
jgi:signal peptidase II